MKALLLEAEWKPREGYRLSELERRTKSSYNGNQTFYNPVLKLIDTPVPKPGPGEVLAKVKATGVCGSDVHMYQKDDDNYTAYPGHCKFPVVLGHEWAGEVLEVGKGVETLKPGVACNEVYAQALDRVADHHVALRVDPRAERHADTQSR